MIVNVCVALVHFLIISSPAQLEPRACMRIIEVTKDVSHTLWTTSGMYFHSSPERSSGSAVTYSTIKMNLLSRTIVPLAIIRTFLTINDVCVRRFACEAWYTLNGEHKNVLNNDLPDKDACRACNTVNDWSIKTQESAWLDDSVEVTMTAQYDGRWVHG